MSANTEWFVTLPNGKIISVSAVTESEVWERFPMALKVEHWTAREE